MENLESKFVELIEKFEMLAAELAPEVLEVGLMTARIAAIQHIIYALLMLLLAGALLWFPKRTWRVDFELKDDKYFCTGLAALPSVVIGIVGLVKILNIWSWVGIFYPEFLIAKQVLGW